VIKPHDKLDNYLDIYRGLAVGMVTMMLCWGLFKETAARSDVRKARIHIFLIKEILKHMVPWDSLGGWFL
jgi:hypothetical protein